MEMITANDGTKLTRALLTCGVIAGPVYIVVGLIQAFTRPGFDATRHDLSLLSNGDSGGIQIANFLLTGLLVIVGAIGIRRVLRGSRSGTWGLLLIGVYGLGLIGAGIFKADPSFGFPPGAPAGPPETISSSGLLHLVFGGIGFLSIIVACFVIARRFYALHQGGWAMYSVITGIVFLLGFFGIATGSGNSWTILGFWIGLVLAWAWLSMIAQRLMPGVAHNHA